jgi:hypothetical protein
MSDYELLEDDDKFGEPGPEHSTVGVHLGLFCQFAKIAIAAAALSAILSVLSRVL